MTVPPEAAEVKNERAPIESASELDALDDRDVLSGYEAGRAGREEPGVEFNRSYWHGWRNGMMDSHRMKSDEHSQKLAHDVIESGWLKKQFKPMTNSVRARR